MSGLFHAPNFLFFSLYLLKQSWQRARYWMSVEPSSIRMSGPVVTSLPLRKRVLTVAFLPHSQMVLSSSML